MAKSKKYSITTTDKAVLKEWYKLLTLGRKLDEKAPNYLKQALGWSYHAPYAGHDGIQLAIGQVFQQKKDHLFPYYRDMLTALSAGLTVEEIILNGISKATDVASGGRHMSNHFAKPEWNIHNVSSATGNHTQHAVGVARGIKTYKDDAVSFSSQGESSTSEGYVYEAINGASREKLPVVFVLQDNRFGIAVPREDQTANLRAADNFRGFRNLHIIHCDGKDIFDSMNAMTEARQHASEQQEPVIVHASVIRMGSHSNSDRHELYRDEKELEEMRRLDPVARFRAQLLRSKKFTENQLEEIDKEVKDLVSKAHKKALKAPDPKPESIYDFVLPEPYKPEKYIAGTHEFTGDKKKFIDALNETLKAEFRHNEHTYLWGQDVAYKEKGGIFNVTKGMQQEFGKERIFNAPIAEDFIVGTANGMSRYDDKIQIVVEGAEFADYFWPAMEQFVEMTHEYWRTNGKFAPNVVIRLASGGYIGGGLYHSQTTEGVMTTFPGIRIVYPSFADDAAGLLRTAMRSKGPTLFLEPKALYNAPIAATPIPDDFEVPFGKARVRREGKHLSIITYGNTVHQSLQAAEKMAEEKGYEIEVLDLRSLAPLDKASVIDTVKKTNRALVVHEDKVKSGFGGELAGIIADEAFMFLDAPVKRVGSTFTPVGFNPILEKAILPNKDKIFDAAMELLEF
ncbi:MAG: 2-oxoisovalerate dehydrogenase [Bacteroidales bacterium]|nr:2-oxoisovalerate dehydrogenase [Bacteroidales bacterium]MCF8328145.1 2-oxoisovalerate dehydrogenase [Bacteroidales bacterium]